MPDKSTRNPGCFEYAVAFMLLFTVIVFKVAGGSREEFINIVDGFWKSAKQTESGE